MTVKLLQVQGTRDYYKYCPGEEHIKLSNAICLGRRRTHYPKCVGCQFNDDEKGLTLQAPQAEERGVSAVTSAAMNAAIMYGESPALRRPDIDSLFFPSEISGIVPDPLSEDAAWRIGHATGQFLRSKLRGFDRADPDARAVIVGRDTRPHGAGLERALVEGIRSTGTDVITLGVIDGAQLCFAVSQIGACGGVYVTAAHRPTEYNGFRICGSKAAPVGLETGLASIRDIAGRVPRHATTAKSRLIAKDFTKAYCDFVRDSLPWKVRLPRLVKLVVDASNGALGRWIPIVFKGVRNLRATRMNFEAGGKFAHEPNPLRLNNTRDVRQLVRTERAAFGVCFDAGGERAVFFDEKGRTIRPEFVLTLLARRILERNPGATIVYDHRASSAVEEEIVRAGGVPIRERFGATFMKRAMVERDAVLGGDLSGRFYFRDCAYAESGLLAMVHVLNFVLTTDAALSDVVRSLQRYSSSGEVRFHCDDIDGVIEHMMKMYADAAVERLDGITFRYPDWWFNVLPVRADRMLRLTLEARSRKLVDDRVAELAPMLGDRA